MDDIEIYENKLNKGFLQPIEPTNTLNTQKRPKAYIDTLIGTFFNKDVLDKQFFVIFRKLDIFSFV